MYTKTRQCGNCGKKLTYSTKYTYQNAKKLNTKCKSCAVKLAITDEQRKKRSERMSGENNPMYGKTGHQNPFFGKHHSYETIQKLKLTDKSYTQTNEFKNKCKRVGNKNGMYGKTVYQIWVEKYGIEKADELSEVRRQKISATSSGKNNGMYGKPSPIGSGNGWSGWYRGWYFRSILELSYMINVIERFKIPWESAEKKEYKVDYVINDKNRTYVADFILNNKYMVEVKPKSLHKSKLVTIKQKAAVKFCNVNNLCYKLVYCTKLTNNEIHDLIESNSIELISRYKQKYDEKFKIQ